MTVNNVLEILRQPCVKWLQIDLALNDFEQSIELVDGQIFNDCLGHSSDFFLSGGLSQRLVDEVGIDLFEGWMTAVDEVAKVIYRRRLVFDQDQKQVQR